LIKNGKYVLILNLGLRSIRAIVFDDKGKLLSHSWLPIKTYIEDEKVEQDPVEWWELGLRVMREVLSEGIKEKIGYITVTSSSCNLVMVDQVQEVIGRTIMVSDKRASKQAEVLKNNPELQELFSCHNILPLPSFLIPKIMWLKENQSDLFNKATHFLSSDSFLLMKLTGEIVSDPLNAEKAFYDVEKQEYPAQILQLLGVRADAFAPVHEVGYNLGTIKDDVAQALGINAEVILTTYDALAAFWGSGVQKGEACVVCGTCSSIRVFSKNNLETKTPGVLSQYFKNKEAFVVGGSNNLGGGVLEWAKDAFYFDAYTKDDNYLFQLMEQEAKESTIGAKGLLFLPYLIGERAPFFDSDVRGMFFGLERGHTRKDMMRSIFESIGFLSLDMISNIEKSGVQVNTLRLSGGLAKNDIVPQLKADITGKKVLLLDVTETTALGCFILIASSLDPDVDLSTLVPIKREFIPRPENHEKYLKLFNLFKRVYYINQENFIYRNKLIREISEDRLQEISNL